MTRYCAQCGKEMKDDANFCPRCGTKVVRRGVPDYTKENKRIAAAARRFKNGDASAFTGLFEETRGYVITIIRTSGVDGQSCDDVMQEVYTKVCTNINTLQEPEKFLGWVKVIARNAAIDFNKRNGRDYQALADEPLMDEQLASNSQDFDGSTFAEMHLPENIAESKDMQNVLLGFIDELPEAQRLLFYSAYISEMSAAEIARETRQNESTVRSRLMRTRERLQKRVNEYAEETGVKLRRSAVVPVLWLMLRGRTADWTAASSLTAQQAALHAGLQVAPAAANVTTSSAAVVSQQEPAPAGGKAMATAGKTASAGTVTRRSGWFAAHKNIVAFVASLAIVVGVGGGLIAANMPSAPQQENTTQASESVQQQTDSSAASAKGVSKKEIFDKKVAKARKAGKTVYTGTLKRMSVSEYLDYQVKTGDMDASIAKEMKESEYWSYTKQNGPYAVLVFDKKTKVSAWNIGMPGMESNRTSSLVLDGNWGSYFGKKIAIQAKATDGTYPSGVDVVLTATFKLSPAKALIASY